MCQSTGDGTSVLPDLAANAYPYFVFEKCLIHIWKDNTTPCTCLRNIPVGETSTLKLACTEFDFIITGLTC